jgi:hypothetical protein
MRATLGSGSRLVLDGLTLAGRALRLAAPRPDPETDTDDDGDACAGAAVEIRHCTLVPGPIPGDDCSPARPPSPSIDVAGLGGATLCIEHSITGPITVTGGRDREPLALRIRDSAVDAIEPVHEAIAATGPGRAWATVDLRRVTVVGAVRVHAAELVEDAILAGHLDVARRRSGCVRFSWIEPGSRTPTRFRCQPDLALEGATTDAGRR